MQLSSVSPSLLSVASSWKTIRSELLPLISSAFAPWPEKALYDNSWTVFGIIHAGFPLPTGTCLCPQTYNLLKDIPNIYTAGFSKLAPKTTIFPHRGNNIPPKYRCHLGLIVPEHCSFTINNQTMQWQEGQWLCFDDADEHSATNQSSSDRIVLLVDILKS